MKQLVGSIVATLALLLGNAVAVAQEQGASTPGATTVADASSSLDGTMWEGTDSQGDFAQYTFLKGGQLRVRSPEVLGTKLETTERKGDSWTQDGSSVRFEMNDYVTYVGTIDGDHISGNASNVKGEHWTWDIKKTTVTAESVPREPSTSIPTGPAETIEITLEADGGYTWRGRTWRVGELKGQLIQESHLHPISEVRLLDPHKRMSVANAIEIATMGQAVGAKPSFEKDKEPGEIIVVPPSGATNTAQFVFAGKALNLPIPAGSCAITKDTEQGRQLYKMQEDATKGTNVVAAVFADCAEWAEHERDSSRKIRRLGNYLAPLMDGEEKILPAEITRSFYIKAGVDDATAATIEKAAYEKLQAITVQARPKTDQDIGVLTYDENAIYLGMVMPGHDPGDDRMICAVLGVTVVNQVAISLNIFADYVEPGSIYSILAEQKANLKGLVDANGK